MSENALQRLSRLLAGVVLLQGRLGHQLLGQLLILEAADVEVAGASVVVAATARQRNAVAQVALRTAAPALAVTLLGEKQAKRLERRERMTVERERQSDERAARLRAEGHAIERARERIAALESENEALRRELADRQDTCSAAPDEDGPQFESGPPPR